MEVDIVKIKRRLVRKDPKLVKLFELVPDLDINMIKKPVYVALIGAIIGQKISYVEAKKYRGRMYKYLGVDFGPEDINQLISKRQVFSEMATDIIKEVNEYILENEIDLNVDLDKLMEVKGIGVWTITTTKLTALTDLDLYPMGDVFLRKRIKMLYSLDHLPTNKEIEEIVKVWSPYRSIVTWPLWRWF